MNFSITGFMFTFAPMMRFRLPYFLFFLMLCFFSCKDKRAETAKPKLAVSIVPQKYFASIIAGDKYDIQVMLPTGSNHETFEPTPRDMEKLTSCRFYFALGALDFEITWMDRFGASNPAMKVVNTNEGITMLSGHIHEHEHDHDMTESEHLNTGVDPHIWLSTECMKTQAAHICNTLATSDTSNSEYYTSNLKMFISLADSVDRIIRKTLAGKEGKSILIFHPALGYFARDYSLNQISIEQEGKEPSPAYLAELIGKAKQQGIKAVFISKEFDTRHAEAIAREIKGRVVVFDPMDADWAENMIRLAQLIADNV